MKTQGRIHSYEVGSAVDGPGLRFVIFTQGCPLRCLYCHNPDTRNPNGGKETSVDELMHEIEKYHAYTDHGHGGVTISGGEPLLQPEFVSSLLRECQAKGFHTALDTSGFASHAAMDLVLPYVNLILLDIKSWKRDLYEKLTHVQLEPTLEFAKVASERGIPIWLRFVLIPELTDDSENIEGVARFAATLKTLKRVEILPFHKLGEYKWEELGLEYSLKKTVPPAPEKVAMAQSIFKEHVTCPVY